MDAANYVKFCSATGNFSIYEEDNNTFLMQLENSLNSIRDSYISSNLKVITQGYDVLCVNGPGVNVSNRYKYSSFLHYG